MMISRSEEALEDHRALEIGERLIEAIVAEIAASGGLLPFDRFMDLALYAPGLGYYMAGAPKFGAGGDFVTAPEISPLFGACIGGQCAQALERLGGGDILEFGPGSGALAIDVLCELERLGALPRRYLLLEPSPDLADRQRSAIGERLPALVERCEWIHGLPNGFRGVVLANEVLDAMPVHRFRVMGRGEVQEAFVVDREGRLSEEWMAASSPGLAHAVAAIQSKGLALAPGYQSEVNLRLGPWLSALAQSLDQALVLLIDYGYPDSAYYQPDRTMGTLMCHLRHQAREDPYVQVGLQDITAHVDFSAAARAGQSAGLTLVGFTTQAHFLIGCGIDDQMAARMGPTGPDLDLIQGVKQLMLPAAMGEHFKVLGLARGIPGPWRGFDVRDLSGRL